MLRSSTSGVSAGDIGSQTTAGISSVAGGWLAGWTVWDCYHDVCMCVCMRVIVFCASVQVYLHGVNGKCAVLFMVGISKCIFSSIDSYSPGYFSCYTLCIYFSLTSEVVGLLLMLLFV